MYNRPLFPFILLGMLVLSGQLVAQPSERPAFSAEAEEGLATPLFAEEDMLELTLRTNLSELLGDRGEDPEYHSAMLLGKVPGEAFSLPVKIKARGNFRRKEENCVFPPLKVKFIEETTGPTIFAGQRKLKLVTHCSEDEYILREYLVYKTFNLLTDSSFRVRLARITYQDETGAFPAETHFAFFIEDDDDMARRNRGRITEEASVTAETVRQDYQLLLHVFMYMIGNRDWDIGLGKNLKVMQGASSEEAVPVPYDFDFCGAVDAPYTYQNISGMEWRSFRPICSEEGAFSACFALFQDKKDEIFALYQQFPFLKGSSSKKVLKFFEAFYQTLEDPQQIREVFLDPCPDRK